MESCATCQRSMEGIIKVLLSNNVKSRILTYCNIKEHHPEEMLDMYFTDLILKEEYVKTLMNVEFKFSNNRNCCLIHFKCMQCIQEQLENTQWKKTIYQFTSKLLCIEKRLLCI